jgi:hypothetical protein
LKINEDLLRKGQAQRKDSKRKSESPWSLSYGHPQNTPPHNFLQEVYKPFILAQNFQEQKSRTTLDLSFGSSAIFFPKKDPPLSAP